MTWQFLTLIQFWDCCIKGALCSFGGEVVVITSKLILKDNNVFILFLLWLCNLYQLFCQSNMWTVIFVLLFCTCDICCVFVCPGTGIPPSRGFFHLFCSSLFFFSVWQVFPLLDKGSKNRRCCVKPTEAMWLWFWAESKSKTDLILMWLYVSDSDISLASNCLLGTLFSLWEQLVYSVMEERDHIITPLKL